MYRPLAPCQVRDARVKTGLWTWGGSQSAEEKYIYTESCKMFWEYGQRQLCTKQPANFPVKHLNSTLTFCLIFISSTMWSNHVLLISVWSEQTRVSKTTLWNDWKAWTRLSKNLPGLPGMESFCVCVCVCVCRELGKKVARDKPWTVSWGQIRKGITCNTLKSTGNSPHKNLFSDIMCLAIGSHPLPISCPQTC